MADQHTDVPAIPGEQLVPADTSQCDLVGRAHDLRQQPRGDGRVVGMGFIECVHDGLKDLLHVGPNVYHGELRAVAGGQLTGQGGLVRGLGPRAEIPSSEGVRLAVAQGHAGEHGRRVESAAQKGGDRHVADQVCRHRFIQPLQDPFLNVRWLLHRLLRQVPVTAHLQGALALPDESVTGF